MTNSEEPAGKLDPNGPGRKGMLFGLPYSIEEAEVVIVPVPWEVTVSQLTGTAHGPRAVLDVSFEVDLFSRYVPEVWKLPMAIMPFPEKVLKESNTLRPLAEQHIRSLESRNAAESDSIITDQVNAGCENLNSYVKSIAEKLLSDQKLVGILGGDHSVALGFLRALSARHDRFGVLQIDGHADLRRKYEGFTYSHASIMYNALKLPSLARLVQVGVRDYCEEESEVIQRSMGRVISFYDEELKEAMFSGKNWEIICHEILRELPDQVYISFDIDGLDPKLCPNTGTPVPGGLEFDQIKFLLKLLARSGKKIIGFDLNEISGDHVWDAQVGARVLFELCQAIAVSNGKVRPSA